jgi:cell wall assembly regulator SMI1
VIDQNIAPVDVSWQRIETWLAAHAPASLEHLNPPAHRDDINAAERLLGGPLPAELVQSLTRHNGVSRWSNLIPQASPMAADTIAQRWQTSMEVAADNDGFKLQPWEDEPWWHPQWVPWAESADGVIQITDLRSGPDRGRLGWAGHSDGGDFTDAWPNLPTLLNAIAGALYFGKSVQGLHPYFTEEGDVWWDQADRHELNGSPLRPAPVGLT